MTTSRDRAARRTRGAGQRDGGARGAPRTLAEELRGRPDSALELLLRARPDLLNPVPNDLTQLATRAGTRASVVRAVERLDRFALQVAEALAVAPDPCPYETLRDLLTGDPDTPPEPGPGANADPHAPPALSPGAGAHPDPPSRSGPGPSRNPGTAPSEGPADNATPANTTADDIRAALPRAVATLRRQALVWGGDDRLRLIRTARELLAPAANRPSPTGLGPTVAEATAGMSPGRLQEVIGAAGLPATHDPVTAVAALTSLFSDRTRMAALLDQAPPQARAVLRKLMWGPPYGSVSAATAETAAAENGVGQAPQPAPGPAGAPQAHASAQGEPAHAASGPAPHLRWLLARGLLLPAGPRNVVLPREVALHLRGGRAHRGVEPVPPPLAPLAERRPQVVDSAAAGQAYTALATVEELLTEWQSGGPAVLRAGGLSVRDLKRTAGALDVTESMAAFWIELAYAAGLLASDGEADERFAPTPAYDEWLRLPAEQRWARLATAWLVATRTPGLVGGRDAKGRTLAALGPDLDRGAAPEVRRRVLGLLASLPAGAAVPADALLARLAWERPLRGAAGADAPPGDDPRSQYARWALAEAEELGVTGRGALAAHGRALIGPSAPPEPPEPTPSDEAPTEQPDLARQPVATPTPAELAASGAAAARLLAPLLPQPLDHVLLQADLTAVAPGPLERHLADVLGVLADVESKGGATVYRFTPTSVRRALDTGRTAADLHAFLAEHSRTPVPQPLAYLIDDVARRHGQLRVGAASAYVRCDDDALLAEILADRRSSGLRLRRLAPTVLAAQADPATLLERLREMGYAPAAESAEGDVLVTRADAYRTPPRSAPAPVPDGPPVPDETLLHAAVRAIRAGDLAATAAHKPAATSGDDEAGDDAAPGPATDRPAPATTAGRLPRTTSAETLATMQAAALTGSAVWIGYVNADGAASQRVIAPVRVEGGFVTGYDHTADEVRTYPLHRITGVAELADDSL
ncbi:helicase-associated domain-containing protein [Streptomyces sp. AC563]|uniref:helicase C-terminal domain-containing protein n=1 Tax=Streptomyces buecherae TaxID=2763006 RepID=UPI00164E7C33|nr:helicase C-terminal domain-containing protein [Streptomyces buecherae]MBC3991002.1 helicase-associated domain-containing protein [Streptomyces buecherae]